MRRAILGLFAALMLSGCAVFQAAYDDQAARECRDSNRGVEREMCPIR